jgi:hypothetical protein
MRFGGFGVLIVVLCIGFVSAGFFDDVFGGMTDNVVAGEEVIFSDFDCDAAKVAFDDEYIDYEIPQAIPFSDDVFNVYIDDEFFASFDLVDKKMTEIRCEVSEDVSYSIYVSSDLIEEIGSGFPEEGIVDFYNEKKGTEDLEIVASGFVKKLKLGLINFGLRIAGWFS